METPMNWEEIEASALAKIQEIIEESSSDANYSQAAKSPAVSSCSSSNGIEKKCDDEQGIPIPCIIPVIKKPRPRKGRPSTGCAASTTPVGNFPKPVICCIVDGKGRCQQQAGNRTFTERMRQIMTGSDLHMNAHGWARHKRMCDEHASTVRIALKCSPSKVDTVQPLPGTSRGDHQEQDNIEVFLDLSKLPVTTLLRYKKHFGLKVPTTATKSALVKHVMRHFKQTKMTNDERQVIQNLANKLQGRNWKVGNGQMN